VDVPLDDALAVFVIVTVELDD
jgi:hypothetical protein